MNASEKNAWATLLHMGARPITLGGKHALDLAAIRIRSARRLGQFCHAFNEVAGRSGSNRRHVNRYGQPTFVVTDDKVQK